MKTVTRKQAIIKKVGEEEITLYVVRDIEYKTIEEAKEAEAYLAEQDKQKALYDSIRQFEFPNDSYSPKIVLLDTKEKVSIFLNKNMQYYKHDNYYLNNKGLTCYIDVDEFWNTHGPSVWVYNYYDGGDHRSTYRLNNISFYVDDIKTFIHNLKECGVKI